MKNNDSWMNDSSHSDSEKRFIFNENNTSCRDTLILHTDNQNTNLMNLNIDIFNSKKEKNNENIEHERVGWTVKIQP